MEEMPIADRISAELEEKNRVLGEYVIDREMNNDLDAAIQGRVHQLALSKVLVNVHNRSSFLLVQAHTNLGENYLKGKYYDQALDHLVTALRLNGGLVNQLEDAKQFHSFILTLLGQCYLEAGGLNDAQGLLEKALQINKALLGEDHLSNAIILASLAKLHTKRKDYHHALDNWMKVWELREAQLGMKHESIVEVYQSMALIYYRQKDTQNALETLTRAASLLQELDEKPLDAIKAFAKLSAWYQEIDDNEKGLDALKGAEQIAEYHYGQIHGQTAKVKRQICMLLLKSGEYQQALEVCLELEDAYRELYGNSSLQFAKNLKVTGTILLIMNRFQQAYEYYTQALNVFRGLKNSKKMIKEIQEKLETIAENMHNSPEVEDIY